MSRLPHTAILLTTVLAPPVEPQQAGSTSKFGKKPVPTQTPEKMPPPSVPFNVFGNESRSTSLFQPKASASSQAMGRSPFASTSLSFHNQCKSLCRCSSQMKLPRVRRQVVHWRFRQFWQPKTTGSDGIKAPGEHWPCLPMCQHRSV